MLKYFNANQKNSLKKLELILNERNTRQKNQSGKVKKIFVKNESPVEFGEPLVLIE